MMAIRKRLCLVRFVVLFAFLDLRSVAERLLLWRNLSGP
jgi:hypothetical protein